MDMRTLSTLPGDGPWELPGKVRPWNILEAKGFFCWNKQINIKIIPSQMEVAPPHRTVDIRQKRRLFKNTKEIEKM